MKKASISNKRLEAILRIHDIDKDYWPQMKALVFYGSRPTRALQRRLDHVDNYIDCLGAILTELFEPIFAQRKAHGKAG
jgi:hypothetical protein